MARVMPCLLVKNGRLVKTVKFKNPAYIGDPVNAIKIYNEKEVDELILLDITASVEARPPAFELLSQTAEECFMPMCYGGGIRSIEDIRRIFSLGIEKVAINSYAFERPEFVKEASAIFGSQSIVASIDVKKSGLLNKYTVYVKSGTKSTGIDPVAYAEKIEKLGAGEILLNSVDRDGTWSGYDIDLVKRVVNAVDIPVIACGGAGTVADLGDVIKNGGASAAAAGSMVVYQGKDLGVLIKFPKRSELEAVLR